MEWHKVLIIYSSKKLNTVCMQQNKTIKYTCIYNFTDKGIYYASWKIMLQKNMFSNVKKWLHKSFIKKYQVT